MEKNKSQDCYYTGNTVLLCSFTNCSKKKKHLNNQGNLTVIRNYVLNFSPGRFDREKKKHIHTVIIVSIMKI